MTMRGTLLALFLTMSLPLHAMARSPFPEIMSQFDLAHSICQTGPVSDGTTKKACRERDRYWRELRDAGYTLRRDPQNPNGYVWE